MVTSNSAEYIIVNNNITIAKSNGIFNIDYFKVGDIHIRYFILTTEDELSKGKVYNLCSNNGLCCKIIIISAKLEISYTELKGLIEVAFKIESV